MPDLIRCFVNESGVEVPPETTVLEAVRLFEPGVAERISAGEGHLTDALGLPLEPGTPVRVGMVIRAVVSARRGGRTAEFDALS